MRNGEVVIIDEFTGRMMPGRRYSEGLHQALEAKEHQPIQPENQTLASITFQNYFRMYEKLAGMTGTALTEADEFVDIYNLEVVEVPTNMPMVRIDDDDEVYRTAAEKYRAILTLIEDCKTRGQPVLVGTTSIEKSEQLAEMLRQAGLGAARLLRSQRVRGALFGRRGRHQGQGVRHPQRALPRAGGLHRLAGRRAGRDHDRHQHGRPRHRHSARRQCRHAHPPGAQGRRQRERRARPRAAAEIREQVARLKEKALGAGGLFVLGTERHESRRIDNQLRGRSGRQGDPGHSKFFLSLEDDLMRIFGSDKLDGMLQRLGLKENEAIVHPWINKALEKAQQKVEARNFDIRKNLLKFDNVMNDQRKVIFDQRVELDEGRGGRRDRRRHAPRRDRRSGRQARAGERLSGAVGHRRAARKSSSACSASTCRSTNGRRKRASPTRSCSRASSGAPTSTWRRRSRNGAPTSCAMSRRSILLQTLDHLWREHLVMLEHLRQVIGLRGYGQRDPLNEYKAEAFNLFEAMSHEPARSGDRAVDAGRDRGRRRRRAPATLPYMEAHKIDPATGEDEMAMADAPLRAGAGAATATAPRAPPTRNPNDPTSWGKVGRNEACPCGSGKKYKHCHGRFA